MIKIIGLGKIGENLLKNLLDQGFNVVGYDICPPKGLDSKYLIEKSSLVDKEAGIYFLCLPSGTPTEEVFQELIQNIPEKSTILDFGNSHYSDSIRREKEAQKLGVYFLDVGISGGPSGARNGACLMVGGKKEVFQKHRIMLEQIATENGLLYTGSSGSGHYVKMIHNGIEYGIMQSISEGFNILANCDLYRFDLAEVAKLFNSGSVIRGWLMELTYNIFVENPKLENLQGIIPSSGEGKWTIEEALRLELNAPVIAQSLFVRYSSNDFQKYGEKITSSLRNQFGGHEVVK